jgi:hypothetical protein
VDFGDDRCQRSHFLMLHNILDRAHAAASIFDLEVSPPAVPEHAKQAI